MRIDTILCDDTYILKEEGNDQESLQSSTTSDPEYNVGKYQNTKQHHIQDSQEVSPFPSCNAQTKQHDRHETYRNLFANHVKVMIINIGPEFAASAVHSKMVVPML